MYLLFSQPSRSVLIGCFAPASIRFLLRAGKLRPLAVRFLEIAQLPVKWFPKALRCVVLSVTAKRNTPDWYQSKGSDPEGLSPQPGLRPNLQKSSERELSKYLLWQWYSR